MARRPSPTQNREYVWPSRSRRNSFFIPPPRSRGICLERAREFPKDRRTGAETPGSGAPELSHSIGGDGRAQRGEVTWAKRAPGNEGWRFAIAYSVVCAGLIASHFLQKAGLTDPVIEDKHAAALEKTISKASDASNSGKDFSFGSDDVPPEVKDMSTGHAISA